MRTGAREFGECMTNVAVMKTDKGEFICTRYTVFGRKKKLLDFCIYDNGLRLNWDTGQP
jgi:hypothetical protein